MLILGISGGIDPAYENRYEFPVGFAHDAAAVLLRDGQVVAGIEEERINRIKHCNKNWHNAVKFCLEDHGVSLDELDAIAIYASETWIRNFLAQYHLLKPDVVELAEAPEFFQQVFKQEFGVEIPKEKFKFVSHHMTHTVSAFAMSGFDDSLVFTVDGVGEGISAMVSSARGKDLEILHTEPEAQSLGGLYRETIRFLGYYMFDEYKVMGLAPYGDASRLRQLFKSFYTLLPEGRYQLHMDRILNLYGVLKPRRRGEDFQQIHKDIAASLQETLETIVFHILTYYKEKTGHTRVCLAGGVAQNSSMNGKLAQLNLFDDVFVQPASHDGGCALGAALAVAHQADPTLPNTRIEHVYWGTPIPENSEIDTILETWSDWVSFRKLDDTIQETAQLLADGYAIGWSQGRSEFGPRALGNRSILADPRPAKNKDTINAMIKKREGYRPFAPSMIEEKVGEYFELPSARQDYAFMTFVLKVKPEHRENLGAVTHFDGTARLQTVSKTTNPKYWSLIHAFGEITGTYMLLNTSFNNNAEPIVDTVEDSLVCYLTSGLDYLIVGDYLVEKKKTDSSTIQNMQVTLPIAAQLTETTQHISYSEIATKHTLNWNYNYGKPRAINATTYQLLQKANGTTTVKNLAAAQKLDASEQKTLDEEIYELWSERRITLSPKR